MAAAFEEEEEMCGGSEFRSLRLLEVGGIDDRRKGFPKWSILLVGIGAVAIAAVLLKPSRAIGGSEEPYLVSLFASQDAQPPPRVPSNEKETADQPAPFEPLLFCFAMVRASGYEPDLLSAQYYNKAGIFACDQHKVYSTGGVAHVGTMMSTEVVAATATMGNFSNEGTATDSWLNTLTFIKAWDMLIEDGKWWTNDWTVKVDPDAVFFPDRLRKKVEQHTGGLNAQPMWVGNCDRTWHNSKPHLKLFGSLEVFSRNAVGTYKAFGAKCRSDLPWHGWGEDMFMQECMNLLKVEAINGTDFLGDKRCYDAPCTDIHKVAFHDFKAVKPFFQCWGQSKGSERVYLEEQERLRLLAEQQKREREEAERLAAIRMKEEQERQARERAEQERLAREEAEQERLAREKAEQEKQIAAQAEEERLKAVKSTKELKELKESKAPLGKNQTDAKSTDDDFELFIRKRK